MALEHIKSELTNFLIRHQLGQPIESAEIVHNSSEIIQYGIKIVSFRRGQLKVAIDDNIQRYLIEKNKEKIIETINQKLGQEKIKTIRFVISRNG